VQSSVSVYVFCVLGCVGWGVITASCWLRRSPVCPVGHLWVAWWALWNGALLAELNRHSHELTQTPWAQAALSLWGFLHTHICWHTIHKMTLLHKHKAHSVLTTGRYPDKCSGVINALENLSLEDLYHWCSLYPSQAGQILVNCEWVILQLPAFLVFIVLPAHVWYTLTTPAPTIHLSVTFKAWTVYESFYKNSHKLQLMWSSQTLK